VNSINICLNSVFHPKRLTEEQAKRQMQLCAIVVAVFFVAACVGFVGFSLGAGPPLIEILESGKYSGNSAQGNTVLGIGIASLANTVLGIGIASAGFSVGSLGLVALAKLHGFRVGGITPKIPRLNLRSLARRFKKTNQTNRTFYDRL